MENTDKINLFRQYMLCGHGRCFSLINEDKELYRETVLYGCLNDISYDLQCEGSRGQFMYNLALEYEDHKYFLDAVIEKFCSSEVNYNLHLMNHLCDIISLFAHDNGDRSAENALEDKYKELYGLLMTLRLSSKVHDIIECFEYLSIVIMQDSDIDRTFEIIRDIGAYFIRRRSAADNDLQLYFSWFMSCAETAFGQRELHNKLIKMSDDSKEIQQFAKIMLSKKERICAGRRFMTADEYINKAVNGKITRSDVVKISAAGPEERMKVAEAAVSEISPEIKANLIQAFTISRNCFPFDADILAGYAESDNECLRFAAMDALLYVSSDKSREIAIKQLNESYSAEALTLFIDNCTCNDSKFLMNCLNNLQIDRDNGDWHFAVTKILDNAGNMPYEALMFVYEKSMCSCCRKYAVDELIKRGLFTDKMKDECRMDCNSDIREIVSNSVIVPT